MQRLFTVEADKIAKESGFIQRERKLSGSSYAQSLVLGWLANPDERLGGLAQHTARAGRAVSPQNLDQRFGKGSVAFMQSLLERAMRQVIGGQRMEVELFKHFKAVRLADSSIVPLPQEFAQMYPGCGNQHARSASLKLQVNLDLLGGELHLAIQNGQASDHTSPVAFISASGELSLRDLGFFSVKGLEGISAAGGYFLSRAPSDQIYYGAKGNVIPIQTLLVDGLDTKVWLGKRLAVRMVVLKVPKAVKQSRVERIKAEAKRKGKAVSQQALLLAGWDIRLTNADAKILSLKAIFVISRLRWQIELWFKVCKSVNQIDESRSRNPFRILTEILAKILGCLIQHWSIAASAWQMPDKSLFRLAKTIQREALGLLDAMPSLKAIGNWLHKLRRITSVGCTVDRRRNKPAAVQLLEELCSLN